MVRSLSLTAYLALARRAPNQARTFNVQRAPGELVWAHATCMPRASAVLQLFDRLRVQRPGIHFLLTTPPEFPKPDYLAPDIQWQEVPQDLVGSVTTFLDHWAPNLCLWTGGDLRPVAIELTAKQNIPLFFVDVEAQALEDSRFRWFPDLSRAILKRFEHITVLNSHAAQRLGRIGISRDKISVTGPLQQGGTALSCNEDLREEMIVTLDRRPVWLAAMVQMDELGIISQAHRALTRMSHRQLLIVVPDDETQGSEMVAKLRKWGWSVAQWAEGDSPDEDTQVLVADTRGEMGLWYRLAPVTMMCSSLVSGFGGCDPHEPAALGSAILYGPNVGRYLDSYGRFAEAGAARLVRNADTLATALSDLSAPDQAATMAHAGWEVSSYGAEVTDDVIERIQDALDMA